MDDEYKYDLHWHALNFRTASIQHADLMWKELEACVERLKAKAIDDFVMNDDENSHWY